MSATTIPSRTSRRYTPEEKAAAVALYEGGLTLYAVAEEVGCEFKTVWRWVHAAGKGRTIGEAMQKFSAERRDEHLHRALRLRKQRYSSAEIAERLELSRRQVFRLFAKARAAGMLA